jgi:hypothetical protein
MSNIKNHLKILFNVKIFHKMNLINYLINMLKNYNKMKIVLLQVVVAMELVAAMNQKKKINQKKLQKID